MRVMVLVKATDDSEKGLLNTEWATGMLEAMGKFNDELRDAGILVSADGLKPSAQGKRVAFDGPEPPCDRRTLRRDEGTGRRILALGGRRHGRGGGLGAALSESHAGAE